MASDEAVTSRSSSIGIAAEVEDASPNVQQLVGEWSRRVDPAIEQLLLAGTPTWSPGGAATIGR